MRTSFSSLTSCNVYTVMRVKGMAMAQKMYGGVVWREPNRQVAARREDQPLARPIRARFRSRTDK
jgi:hypothetical protein